MWMPIYTMISDIDVHVLTDTQTISKLFFLADGLPTGKGKRIKISCTFFVSLDIYA